MPSLGTLSVDMVARTGKLTRQLRSAEKEISFSAKNMGRLSASMQAGAGRASILGQAIHIGMSLARAAFVAALAAASAFAFALKSVVDLAGEFETEMARVGAVSGATDEQMAALKNQALAMSRTVAKSASDLARGQSFLAMAGFNVNEVLGSMPAVARLATVGMMDLGRASDIATNIMTSMGIGVDGIDHAVGVMISTITSSNTNMVQLGEAMKMVNPVARSLGISIEQTAAALGVLGDAGQQGELGGTALRNILLRLVNPTKKSADLMKFLGVQTKDAFGKFKSIPDIVKEFERVGATVDDIAQIFGTRGGPAFLNLLSRGSNALREVTRAREEATSGAEVEAAILNTYEAQLKNLEGQFKAVAIAAGDEFKDSLKILFGAITESADGVVDLDEKTRMFAQQTINAVITGVQGMIVSFLALNPYLKATVIIFKALWAVLNIAGASMAVVFKSPLLALETLQNAVLGVFSVLHSLAATALQINSAIFSGFGKELEIEWMQDLGQGLEDAQLQIEGMQKNVNKGIDTTEWQFVTQQMHSMVDGLEGAASSAGNYNKELAETEKEGQAAIAALEGFRTKSNEAFQERGNLRRYAKNLQEVTQMTKEASPGLTDLGAKFVAFGRLSGDEGLHVVADQVAALGAEGSVTKGKIKELLNEAAKLYALGDLPKDLMAILDDDIPGSPRGKRRKDKPPKGKDNRLARMRAEAQALREMGDARFVDLEMQIKGIELQKMKLRGAKKQLVLEATMKKLLEDLTSMREKAWQEEQNALDAIKKKEEDRAQLSSEMWAKRIAALRETAGAMDKLGLQGQEDIRLQADMWELQQRLKKGEIDLTQFKLLKAAAEKEHTDELRKQVDLEREKLALIQQQRFEIAEKAFQGLSEGLDAGAVRATIEQKTEAERLAHLQSTDMQAFELEQVRAGNQAWEERISIMSKLAGTLGEVSGALGEAMLIEDEKNRHAMIGLGILQATQAIGAATADMFVEDTRKKIAIQAGLNFLLAGAAILIGATTGNVAAFAAGAAYLAQGIGNIATLTAASKTKSEFRAPRGTTAAEGRTQTRDAILDALKEAGLYRPDLQNVTQNFFGSDPVTFKPGRAQARRNRAIMLEYERSRL